MRYLAVVLSIAALPASGAELTGRARVVDGDTLAIGTTTVRLFGIDAPEGKQTCVDARDWRWACGTAAARRLEALIAGRPVTCDGRGDDDYGRVLAVCRVGGQALNPQLVREGLAWAFVRYSDAYAGIEQEARGAERGVFAAQNTPPWDYRAQGWSDAAQVAPKREGGSCPIKGNVSGAGRIYHLPWQRDYARTRIDESRGERWFCDEGEALAAGWRKAAR